MKLLKFYFIFAFMCAMMTTEAQIPYKVIVPVSDLADGEWVYMSDIDKRIYVDSARVADHTAVFKGDVDEPYMVSFSAGDHRYGTLVLEQGTSTINQATGFGVGTMLNDRLKSVIDELTAVASAAQDGKSDRDSIIAKYVEIERNAISENSDNPIAYFLFLDLSSYIPDTEQLELVSAYPQLAEYDMVKHIATIAGNKRDTQPGCAMRDFEVSFDGSTTRLSDYVGKGKYVLVDFWASWCAPCMRELATLKQLYEQYSDKGLELLGVAVWDEPEASLSTISSKEIPWPCIIGGGEDVTDVYGINAIPCIILFGPDGTILSRDLQGDALRLMLEQEFKPLP